MKILVVWNVKPDADQETIQKMLVDEEKFAWRLYLGDQLREHYASDMPAPAISILEMESIEAAKQAMEDLPLNKAGFLDPVYYPLRPFDTWEVLFRDDAKVAHKAE